MKVNKILSDMVKDYFKNFDKFNINYKIGSDDNYVYVVVEGHVMYVIPKRLFILDINMISGTPLGLDFINSVFKGADNAKPLTYKFSKELPAAGKPTNCDFYTLEDSKEEVVINPKLIKYFDKPELEGVSHKEPVFIYEGDNFVGLVMPIKLKK